jgi:hypothetical protein
MFFLRELRSNVQLVKGFQPDLLILSSKFPSSQDLNDGYFQRVVNVDKLFESKHIKRVYLNTFKAESSHRYLSDYCLEISSPNRFNRAAILILLLRRVRFLYAHSILRLENRHVLKVIKILKTKTIVDFHGVVPEEARLQGGFLHAQNLDDVERSIVKSASKLIIVSDNMQEHFLRKYPSCEDLFLKLPIQLPQLPTINRAQQARYDFAYIGGTQPWQNLAQPANLARTVFKDKRWLFIVPNPLEFVIEYGPFSGDVEILSSKGTEAFHLLSSSTFGLLPRKDSIVNSVSFPTKISDYVVSGCVPLIGEGVIGGIEELGLQYVTFNQLLNESWPSESELELMRRKNREKYDLYNVDSSKSFNEFLTSWVAT